MKWLLTCFCVLAGNAAAQAPDPLTVTLPSGKVVHFESAEQKAKFEAARTTAASKAQPTAAPTSKPSDLGHSALDEKPRASGGGINTSAPAFTADYYMADPKSWEGKKVTLSVAYVIPGNPAAEEERTDGMSQMTALTSNNDPSAAGTQDFGGTMIILAPPDVARRLVEQCGTRLRFDSHGVRATMIRGQIEKLAAGAKEKEYGFFVNE
jgi:hypothetical protein